jgi:hypothetical protein
MHSKLHNTYQNVKCQSFIDPETGRLRVRTRGNSFLEDGIMVECSKTTREQYPVGTWFYAEEMKVCIKPNGRVYCRAKNQEILVLYD